ncbi:MAG: hypothetical protein H7A25_08885 [Leptospiraceae bacterium]|nr:hypothetical protein [Leptospiraceae bacterium]MCP5500005.1 hypothetical protein [Leptospiraceae bacterium]
MKIHVFPFSSENDTMSRVIFIYLILFICLPIYSHDERNEVPGVYKNPDEVIEDTAGREASEDTDKEIQNLKKSLDSYYSQFVEGKRTWHERNSQEIFKNQSINQTRLLMRDINSEFSESGRLRDSLILFQIHAKLGVLYSKKYRADSGKDPYSRQKAIEHYLNSFRYRDLSSSENSFLYEKNWREIRDDSAVSARKLHTSNKQAYETAKKDFIQKKQELYRNKAKLARDFAFSENTYSSANPSIQIRNTAESIDREMANLEKELEEKKLAYEESYKNNYLPYKESKDKENADVLFRLAGLVRELEEESLQVRKQRTQIPIPRDPRFIFDSTRERDFPAYRQILHLAHRFEPSNKQILFALADEHRMAGKTKEAADYFESYISTVCKENLKKQWETLEEKDKKDTMQRNLIGVQFQNNTSIEENLDKQESIILYRAAEEYLKNLDDTGKEYLKKAFLYTAMLRSQLKQNVKAAYYYERYLERETDEEKKTAWEYYLGNFYFEKIGDRHKSVAYFQTWLSKKENEQTDDKKDLKAYLDRNIQLFHAYAALDTYSIYTHIPPEERSHTFSSLENIKQEDINNLYHIEKAYRIIINLEELLYKEKQEESQLKSQFLAEKKKLLPKTDDNALLEYHKYKTKLQDLQERIKTIQTTYKSLKQIELLFRFAELEADKRNFHLASEIYREIINKGNELEISHARENLESIEKTLQDGRIRELSRLY